MLERILTDSGRDWAIVFAASLMATICLFVDAALYGVEWSLALALIASSGNSGLSFSRVFLRDQERS